MRDRRAIDPWAPAFRPRVAIDATIDATDRSAPVMRV